MNIEIANRLVQLRKEHNLSQEELADKLGLSRQAVSKWERAEASPDTDNLICLARLYGVSLDDLLSTDETSEEIKEDVKEKEEAKKESVSIDSSGIHVVDGDESVHIEAKGLKIHINDEDDDDDHDDYDDYIDEDGPKGKAELIFDSIGFVLAAIAYILMGFFWKTADGSNVGWGAGWVVFLLPIVFGSIFAAIRKKKVGAFNFPVLVTFAFLAVGMFTTYYGQQPLWHPMWVVFLLIPVFYSVAHAIDTKGNPEKIIIKKDSE